MLQGFGTAAHLDHQDAVTAQVVFRLSQNFDDQIQAILAAIETDFRFGKVFRRQLPPFRPGDIGWIADQDVIFFSRQCVEQVGMDQIDLLLQAMPLPIDRGNFQGIHGKIQRIDVRIGEGVGTGNGNTATAGAQIEYIVYPIAVHPGGKMRIDQFGNG